MKELIIKVTGVTFDNRQSVIALLKGNEPIRLEPEPENKYDPNALAVKVAVKIPLHLQSHDANQINRIADGIEIKHVGYVPKELAAEIAPLLDGESLMVKIKEITGGFELSNGKTALLGLLLTVEMPDLNPYLELGGFDKP